MAGVDIDKKVINQKIAFLERWFFTQIARIRRRQRKFFCLVDKKETKEKIDNIKKIIDEF